jgi:hypothetical protein
MQGITFKENCPDVRILRSINTFQYYYGDYHNKPMILADPDAVHKEYDYYLNFIAKVFDAVVLE